VFETGAGFGVFPRRKELTLNHIAQPPADCTLPVPAPWSFPLTDRSETKSASRWVARHCALPPHLAALVAERAGLGIKETR